MAKYSADIEIAVRGAQGINTLIRGLNRLNNSINVVNKNAKLLEGRGFNVASIENYSRAVAKAERAVNKAAAGTDLKRRAITQLVTAMELENKARSRRNFLIAQEVASRRQVIATANAGVGVQGPALPRYMMTGPSSPIGGGLRGRGGGGRGGGAAGGIGSRLGGAVSGSIIGGAFPLLFGQGAGAAAGGAIGGLLGGLAGPGGSFAGSLLGTLLGDIASKGQGIKDLAEDMGLAAEQTKELSAAFQLAGADADKFSAAVQTIRGIGFAEGTEIEAIKLVSRLTEEYGGKIDKVAAAYGNFVAKGKVGVADINKFTAQGIPILDELEKRYGKNRDQILGMAKDGKITAQALSDALRDIANRSDQVTKKVTSSWEQTWINIQTGASTSASAFAIIFGRLVSVSSGITGNIAQFFSKLYLDMVNGAVNAAANIANALANTANNIAAFYKANPLVVGSLRDAAVKGLEGFKAGARGTAKDLQNLVKAQNAVTGAVAPITVPGQAPPSGSSGAGRARKDRSAEIEQQTQERLRALAREAELVSQITVLKELQFNAELVNDKELQIRLKGEENIVQIIQKTASELDKVTDKRLQQAILATAETEIVQTRQETELELFRLEEDRRKKFEETLQGIKEETSLAAQITEEARRKVEIELEISRLQKEGVITTDAQKEAYRNATNELDRTKQKTEEIINAQNRLNDTLNQVGQTIGDVFQQLIFSTDNWTDSLRNALGALSNILFQAALTNLAGDDGVGFFSFLTGGLGRRANGGPVTSGSPYIVGERGPELFVPGRSGTIIPNERMGGVSGTTNVVVNVDAKGSSVQGDDGRANELGRVVSAAVQSEIIKQQRPGGLLAGTAR